MTTTRPTHRRDCVNGPRPCPWAGCRFHLALEVKASGKVVRSGGYAKEAVAQTASAICRMKQSCALDVIEQGAELELKAIAPLFGVNLKRVQQIESEALRKLYRDAELGRLEAFK